MGHNISIHKKTHPEVPTDPIPVPEDPQPPIAHPIEEASQNLSPEVKKELSEYEVEINMRFNKIKVDDKYYSFSEMKELLKNKTAEERAQIINALKTHTAEGNRSANELSVILDIVYDFINTDLLSEREKQFLDLKVKQRRTEAFREPNSRCGFDLNTIIEPLKQGSEEIALLFINQAIDNQKIIRYLNFC